MLKDSNILVKAAKHIKFVYYSRSLNELADLIAKRYILLYKSSSLYVIFKLCFKKKIDVYPCKISRYVNCSPYDAFINNSNCYMSHNTIKFSWCPINHGSTTPHFEFVLAKLSFSPLVNLYGSHLMLLPKNPPLLQPFLTLPPASSTMVCPRVFPALFTFSYRLMCSLNKAILSPSLVLFISTHPLCLTLSSTYLMSFFCVFWPSDSFLL